MDFIVLRQRREHFFQIFILEFHAVADMNLAKVLLQFNTHIDGLFGIILVRPGFFEQAFGSQQKCLCRGAVQVFFNNGSAAGEAHGKAQLHGMVIFIRCQGLQNNA